MQLEQPDAPAREAAPDASRFASGAACGVAAVSIWAGWLVLARLGVRTSLTPWDIAALRFAVAGTVLLPVLLRRGLALDRLGWTGLVALALGGGAPTVLLAVLGLLFAPAAHAAALFAGVTPLLVALLAAALLKERFGWRKRAGLALILAGALAIAGPASIAVGGAEHLGHLMFLAAAFLWACYTVAMRRAHLDGLHAAAIAAVISLLAYLPAYLVWSGSRLLAAPVADIALQAVFQGFLTAVVSQFLYGRSVTLLGASGGAAFAALVPAMAALLAIPLLGEMPAGRDWVGIILVSAGVYFVGGGPLPRRQRRLRFW